jgi:hypothetical protein
MMSGRRALTAVLVTTLVLLVGACGGESASTSTAQAQWGALGENEAATYEFVVPYGTSVRIDQGQVVDLMPRLLEVQVGESIRIDNQDSRDYMIGPFYVTAGQSLAMRFTHEGQLSGVCSMNPEGEFVIKVAA